MGKLDGKIALITGASSGIGQAVAAAFAADGACVAINYPDAVARAGADKTAAMVEAHNVTAATFQADVSDERQVDAMIDAVVGRFGRIDILINNAGIATTAPVEDLPVEEWDRVLAVNLRSVFLVTRRVLPLMRTQGFGKIINTASQLAYSGAPGFTHYTASKGAIISFTRSLALEIGGAPVNVNCVAPGATETPILGDVDDAVLDAIRAGIPRGRLATVEEIAPAYVFLASADADHFVGQTISPNGGDVML